MKTLIFLLLFPLTIFSQNVVLNGTFGVVELQSNKTYIVKGETAIQNINWNGSNVTLLVESGATLKVNALNINNKGTFINNGSVIVSGWIDANSITKFVSTGSIISSGTQNNTDIPFEICGEFKTGSIQFNRAGIVANDCCLYFEAVHVDVNTNDIFIGNIHAYIKESINLNNRLTNDNRVTYKYDKQVNDHSKWGSAVYIDKSESRCNTSLPITIEYFKFVNKEIIFKFSEVNEVERVNIQYSKDGKIWETITTINNVQPNREYKVKP